LAGLATPVNVQRPPNAFRRIAHQAEDTVSRPFGAEYLRLGSLASEVLNQQKRLLLVLEDLKMHVDLLDGPFHISTHWSGQK
jgi:hypothetical protein